MISCTFENGTQASPPLRHVIIDAVIVDGEKILLVKRAPQLTGGNKWAFVGGFVQHNEFIKETLAREVTEETGHEVIDMTLFMINDNPSRNEDRQNIAMIFICKVGNKIGEPDWENTEIKWFDFDNLPKKEEFAFDHYKMLQVFLQYRKEKVSLPIF
ncbi:MAG TPA: NUDIX hydrolase [Patescibacteria group bacterium]|nr:NUDIX hydrolase [Patescibacteria group bacterium]